MARVILLVFLFLSIAAAHTGDSDPDSSSEKPNLRSRSLILVKIWCLILVFVATFLAGISPYFLKWNEGFLVMGIQFAGGVFLGTALMHFLSDSNATFEDLTSKEYPFAFMLASAGYLLTMSADAIISYMNGKTDTGKDQNGIPTNSVSFEDNDAVKSTATSLGDSILLIAALCFHSVFEGIAIGVAETKTDAWRALWTVCLHKIFAAIAMGIALLRMIPDRPFLSCASYAFAFAISSPIGVAIGIVIDSTTQGVVADWIYAISMGLASGVFVYIAINHLLTKGSFDSPFFRFVSVCFGVGIIAVVMIWDT